MKLKINVKTPNNQAKKCIETQKKSLLGLTQSKKVLEQKVIKHNEFFWIIECDSEKEREKIIKKCANGEVLIKKFYSVLFHIIGKANKLADKFKKGIGWIRRFLIKRLKKTSQQSATDKENGMIKQIESMSDDELKNFIKIHDRESMQKLLSGAIIKIKEIE